MSLVVDTGVVLAVLDDQDARHRDAARWIESVDEDLVTTPLAVAELDHLILARGGAHGRDVLWDDLDRGVYHVRWWADGLSDTLALARQYPFAGLVDASLVALTRILRTTRIATFDPHFRSITTPSGEPLVLLPDDA